MTEGAMIAERDVPGVRDRLRNKVALERMSPTPITPPTRRIVEEKAARESVNDGIDWIDVKFSRRTFAHITISADRQKVRITNGVVSMLGRPTHIRIGFKPGVEGIFIGATDEKDERGIKIMKSGSCGGLRTVEILERYGLEVGSYVVEPYTATTAVAMFRNKKKENKR